MEVNIRGYERVWATADHEELGHTDEAYAHCPKDELVLTRKIK